MSHYIGDDLMWFRFGRSGCGFAIKRTKPLFSERMGLVRVYSLPFGWRLRFLGKV